VWRQFDRAGREVSYAGYAAAIEGEHSKAGGGSRPTSGSSPTAGLAALGRGGLEIRQEFVNAARGRLRGHVPDDTDVDNPRLAI
jgi:hypothetical protein